MIRRDLRVAAAILGSVIATAGALGLPVRSQASQSAVTKAKKLTAARAEAAIEKKVRSAYGSQVGRREIQVGCRRLSSRRYACEYGVLTGESDQTDDQDRDPYRYEGTGSVRKPRHGALVVRVTRPR